MEEKKSPFCTLTDQELIEKATELIQGLIDSGGSSWVLNIPARPNADPDLIFTELNFRFKNLVERPQPGAWVKASERLPMHKAFWLIEEGFKKDCSFPVRIDGKKYGMGEVFSDAEDGNSIFYISVRGYSKDFYEDEFHRLEWLSDESPAEQPVVTEQDAFNLMNLPQDTSPKGMPLPAKDPFEQKKGQPVREVELIKHIRENYKVGKGVWKDKFGIAELSDEGVLEMFNQHQAEWSGEKEGKR